MASEYRQNTSYEVIKKDYTSPTVEVSEGSDEVGGGNKYSLPFGLCKGVGIDTTGMTPREAWDAYTGKTGISKEQAEKEHWGKDSSNAGGEKNDNSSQVKWKKDDVIKIGGLTARVLDVDREGRTVVEVLEGERGLRHPGSKFMFMKNSPAAESAEIVTDSVQADSGARRLHKSTLYPINEDAARRSKEAVSFGDYTKGSATEGYKRDVEIFDANVNRLIEKYKSNDTLTQDDWERVYALAGAYSKNRAEFTNEYNRINASYPSWFITGPSNYNTARNDKKMRALDKVFSNQGENIDPNKNTYLTKIEAVLSNQNIKSNDSNAVAKLQAKYDGLKAELERGKQMNAYFRKNKTLVGFPGVSDAVAKAFDEKNKSGDYFARQPYAAYRLQNGSAELRRLQGRIDELKTIKTSQTTLEETASSYPQAKGVTVQENAEQMRVQLRFEGKPDEETRTLLKSHGFRWSPSQGAWQRQLTGNGKYAAKQIMQKLSEKGE